MSQFVDRMIRASKPDAHLYEEVEPDTGAMGQTMGVVGLSSLAVGVPEGKAGFVGFSLLKKQSLLPIEYCSIYGP